MAGSRTEKIGSIFYRVQGLIKSGAMKPSDKPIWYEVYAAFPPKVEPKYDRILVDKEPRNILYKEDLIRARFYKTFQSDHPIDMTDESTTSLSQKFIEKFEELEKEGGTTTDIFENTAQLIRREGFTLKTQEEMKQELEERRKEIAKKRKLEQEQRMQKLQSLTMADVFGQNVDDSGSDNDAIDEVSIEEDLFDPPTDRG